jgi:hypothetical protein
MRRGDVVVASTFVSGGSTASCVHALRGTVPCPSPHFFLGRLKTPVALEMRSSVVNCPRPIQLPTIQLAAQWYS